MYKWLVGLTSLFLAIIVFSYFHRKDIEMQDNSVYEALRLQQKQKDVNEFIERINTAKTIAELSQLEKELSKIDEWTAANLLSYIKLKDARLQFYKAEEDLQTAVDLESALAPEGRTELNPLTVAALKKAVAGYDNIRKQVDNLTDGPNMDFNYHVNYLRGCVYHRILQFASDETNAQELFNQTLQHYKNALRYHPADINTVINIELLIKDQQDLANNAGQPKGQRQRKQMLNIKKAGLNPSTGN